MIALEGAIVFWLLVGHDLRLDMFAYNDFWYSEKIPWHGKITISALFGLLCGMIVAASIFIWKVCAHTEATDTVTPNSSQPPYLNSTSGVRGPEDF